MPVTDDLIIQAAEQYGTPMYLYDGNFLTDHFLEVRKLLHPKIDVFLSLKANGNLSIVSLLRSLGSGVEVASIGELKMALHAGYPPENILFSGPGKREEELLFAISTAIYCIIVESIDELQAVNALAAQLGVSARVGIRINPNANVSGAKIKMGGVPRQFGLDETQLDDFFSALKLCQSLRFVGIHIYTGTQNLDPNSIYNSFAYTIDLAKQIYDRHGICSEMIDIGGGMGVPYFPHEQSYDFAALADRLNHLVESVQDAFPDTRFIIESGRFILAESAIYLSRILYKKESKGEKFLITDGGLHHHQASTFRGRTMRNTFPLRVVRQTGELRAEESETVTLVGPLCTPEDCLARNVELPSVVPGDLIAVQKSGAYGLSYSPVLFLGHRTPAEVLILDHDIHLIREHGTDEDLLHRQHLLSFPVIKASATSL